MQARYEDWARLLVIVACMAVAALVLDAIQVVLLVVLWAKA